MNKSCLQYVCTHPYGYNCGLSHCSKDEASCKSLIRLKQEIRSFNSLRFHMGIERMFEKKLETNNKFLESIRVCQKHAWKLSDVCIRGIKCRIHQKVIYLKKEKQIIIFNFFFLFCLDATRWTVNTIC